MIINVTKLATIVSREKNMELLRLKIILSNVILFCKI